MGAFLLGPFMIKHIYIVIIIAAIAAFYMLKWNTRKDKPFQQIFLNTMFNSVFIWFLTYKFSSIIFQPTSFINNPLSILYFTGGSKGSVLGLILAFVYLFLTMKKRAYALNKWFPSFVYGIVTFFISFWLVRTLFLII